MNQKLKAAKLRSQLYKEIRNFFEKNDYLEVETPIMVKIPGIEPHLSPFETDLNFPNSVKKEKLFLNTSPELQMKKLLAIDGFEKIFNITKVFRNGEFGGGRHNPEFTMLEWYRKNSNYLTLMDETEKLIKFLSKQLNLNPKNCEIHTQWEKKTVNELFIEKIGIDLEKNKDFKSLSIVAKKTEISTKACNDWDDIFFKIFLNKIEPNLGKEKPTFVYDYPASQAALSKKKKDRPFWAERFELYISGHEIANAYSELLDHSEQEKRLKKEQTLRKSLKKTKIQIDQEFLQALTKIKKETSGIALGLDRLLMALTETKKIEDLLLFPFESMI